MRELCHRCHRELPAGAAADRHDDENAVHFCPFCAAPQLLLPEHMRVEPPVVSGATTGTLPPPPPSGLNPNQIDWRTAILAGALVAAVGAVLAVLAKKYEAMSLLSIIWTISCAVIVLGLYARNSPAQRLTARAGLRIGVVAGLLVIAANAMAIAATGVVLRFKTQQMAEFDKEYAERRQEVQPQVVAFLQQQGQDQAAVTKFIDTLNSPEMKAGSALLFGAFQSFVILLLSAGGGAFAGMMRAAQAQRLGRHRSD